MKDSIPHKIWEDFTSFLTNKKGDLSQETKLWLKEEPNKNKLKEIVYYREAFSRKNNSIGKEEVRESILSLVTRKKKSFIIYRYAGTVIILLGLSFFTWTILEKNKSNKKFAENTCIERYNGEVKLIMSKGKVVNLSEHKKQSILIENGIDIVSDTQNLVIYKDVEKKLKNNNILKPDMHHLIVPKGADYQLVLADGTKVWLNSESELKYPSFFTGDMRIVELKGEAFFRVERDEDRKFITRVKGLNIEVLGTSYNISAYPEDEKITTTLVSGLVKAKSKDKSTLLKPSQQLIFDKEQDKWELKTVDVDDYVSWKNGIIQIKAYTFEQIVVMLKRWYDFEMFYMNESIKDYKFKGALDKNLSLKSILKIMEQTTDIRFKIKGKVVTVYKDY